MKQLLFFLCALFAFPVITLAHSTVSTTTPANGDVVTEELGEVTVEFASEIEKQSTLTLMRNQEQISMDILIDETNIHGRLPSPLENGDYTLHWQAVAKDGHIVEGNIQFSVNLTGTNKMNEEGSNEALEQIEEEKTEEDPPLNFGEEETPDVKEDNQGNNSIFKLALVIFGIVLAVGNWILFRKKR